MSYEFLCKPLSPWQEKAGDYGDVVIDSRIRLSRNLKNYVFPQRASDAELAAVFAEGQRMTPLLSAMGRGRYAFIDLDELTPTVLNDMVKAVYVHAPDKSSGHREQQIDISYDLVGILPASLLGNLSNGETA